MVSSTLGEVKNRADVVVFWGVDPVTTHPRHWERYSVEPVGRFVTEGRAGRTVLVADTARTPTAERADSFLELRPEGQFEALGALRSLVLGIGFDAEAVERATGAALEALRDWADRMVRARYGAFFFGSGLGRPPGDSACVEAALALVRDFNSRTRFVALELGRPGNPAGAEAVLAWQAGFPLGADFRRGEPRDPLDQSTEANTLLTRGEADAALIVAAEPSDVLSREALDHLARIPTIHIGPDATAPARAPSATVAMTSAACGIHTAGTVIRTDGVSLPLRRVLSTPVATDRELLGALDDRVRAR